MHKRKPEKTKKNNTLKNRAQTQNIKIKLMMTYSFDKKDHFQKGQHQNLLNNQKKCELFKE